MYKKFPCYYPGDFNPPTKFHINTVEWLLNRPEIGHVYVVLGNHDKNQLYQDKKAKLWEMLIKSSFSPNVSVIKSVKHHQIKEIKNHIGKKKETPFYIALDEGLAKSLELQKHFDEFPNYSMEIIPSQFKKSSDSMIKAVVDDDKRKVKSLLPDTFNDQSVKDYIEILKNQDDPESPQERSPYIDYKQKYINKFNDGFWSNVFEHVANSISINESLDEDIKAGTFTAYHRTQIDDPKKFNLGFKTGGGAGAMYGPGIYLTYELKDQLKDGMKAYGPTIVEYEIKNNNKFLIFDKDQAKKVFGSDISLIGQLKKILSGNFLKFYKDNKEEIDKLNSLFRGNKYDYSSEIAYPISKIPNIEKYVDGMIFTGRQDARVLALYNTNIGNPIRYSKDDAKSWNSMKNKSSYKIGRDERGDSKKLNFLNIANRGDFKDLSNEEKKKYVEKIIEKGYVLPDKQFEYVPDDLKKKYIERVIENGYPLPDKQFEYASDDLKKKYVEKRIENGNPLPDKEFEYASDNLKKKYIERVIEKGYGLSDKQFKYASDDLKKYYIEKRIENGYELSDKQFYSLSDDLKKKYVEKRIENGYPLPDKQFEYVPDDLKKKYVEKIIERGYVLFDKQFEYVPDDLKKKYIERVIENGYPLPDKQFEYVPDDLKKKYIERVIENGNPLPDKQKEWAEKHNIELNESFNFSQISDDEKKLMYKIFSDAYKATTGTSWDEEKFMSRAKNWDFYGDEKGYVAVRRQYSGYSKLVGVAGNSKSILNGLNELEKENIPVWGMVSKEIQKIMNKKGYKTPNAIVMNVLLRLIPKSVFGGADYKINLDGSITLDYEDTGKATKYFVGNDRYFDELKKQIASGALDKIEGINKKTIENIKNFF